MDLIIVAGIGLLAGFSGGLLGIGGGVIVVPLLIMLRHFDIHKAIGTSMAAIILITIFGAFFHHKAGMVDIKMAVLLGGFGILGVWAGSHFSISMDAVILRRIFSVFLVVMALKLFFIK